MIKYATEIKFVKDSYTAPMIVEFSSPFKSGNNTINIASIYCKILAAMKIVDSSLNFITQYEKIFEHLKDFPAGNDYKKKFQTLLKNLIDLNPRISPVTKLNQL